MTSSTTSTSPVAQFFEITSKYPALTVGLTIFTFFLYIIDDFFLSFYLAHKFSLSPQSIGEFDLNRVSFYILYHKNILHWLFNVVTLFTPLAIFERNHGTVHTGITLNLLAVVTAIQYTIVGLFLYPDTSVIGLSGIAFSFLSYLAFNESKLRKTIHLFHYNNRDYTIPTLYTPVITLFLCLILIPGSSFFGHLFGLTSGYLLSFGYIKFLYPPPKVVLFIENKLSGAIAKLDGLVIFYKEEDNHREISYTSHFDKDLELGSFFNSLTSSTGITATSTSTTTAAATEQTTFRGDGHVLGA
ncbi:rhomboid protein 2 [Scheffersomyces coipomensis]|uniref:rhomboid protein 2 n=1 Tax=Scheffersomyces coipomensis TaxID=1788519 RepID=UPI00315D2A7F